MLDRTARVPGPEGHVVAMQAPARVLTIWAEQAAALAAESDHPNPFAQPEAILAAARRLGGADAPAALLAHDGDGRIEGLWPLLPRASWAGLPAAQAPLLRQYCTSSAPLLRPGRELAAMAAMLAEASSQPHGHRSIVLHALPLGSSAAIALRALARDGVIGLTVLETWERAVLQGRKPEAEALGNFSAKRRRNLRASARKLGEAHGALRLVRHRHDLEPAFGQFLDLEASGWKGRQRTALKCRPDDAAMARELLHALGQRGQAEIPVLYAGETPVAAGLLLHSHGHWVFWRTAYADGLAEYSPGVLLDIEVTRALIAEPDFRFLDSATDETVDLQSQVWPDRMTMGRVLVELQPGSTHGRALRVADRLRREAKALKRRWRGPATTAR